MDREFNIPFIFTIKDEQDLDNINYKLIEEFDKISKYISERYVQAEYNNILKLTEEEKNNFKNDKNCWICNKKLNRIPEIFNIKMNKIYKEIDTETDRKVIDLLMLEKRDLLKNSFIKVVSHCRLSRKYKGAAHNICNLNLAFPQDIPVSCHNSTNYDTHLFIVDLIEKYHQVKLIANTDEKYINYKVNTGHGYNFNKDGNPTKYIKLSFIKIKIQIHAFFNRKVS